jgi:hypothetical protein
MGRAWVVPGLRWGWLELSPSQAVNNLHTFAIEKNALGKRRMFNLEYNIDSPAFPILAFLS